MSHSASASTSRLTVPALRAMKGQQKIVCLTAYTAPMAQLMDGQVDVLLVGDSLGMVLYGMESTMAVSLEMMIAHGQAVHRGAQRTHIMIDLPFGSYQQSPQQAFENAARVMQETNCHSLKLEGGMEMVDTVRFLSERGIPVCAHIGLRPQNVHVMGGYKCQGRDDATAALLLQEAQAFEQAGAFSLLLEGMAETTAQTITQAVSIPTIGIGASPACDGQVLVSEDMLGLFERTPKFVKRYGNLRERISQAVGEYTTEVRAGTFPAPEHCFKSN